MTPHVIATDPSFRRSIRRNALSPVLLAIEVMSPEQTVRQMMKRAADYFSWGVENVWMIDPQRESAIMIRTGKDPTWLWADAKIGVSFNDAYLSFPIAEVFA